MIFLLGDMEMVDVMESKLQKAFQIGLDITGKPNYETLVFAKSEGWDSIAHLKLVAAIEQEFGIMLDTKDMLDISSYSIAKEIVKKYI
jgi:acyl carrier protein